MKRARLIPFAWLFGGKQTLRPRARGRFRTGSMTCELLEARVVLSGSGVGGFAGVGELPCAGSLTSELSEIGVLANFSSRMDHSSFHTLSSGSTSQFASDLEKLQKDLSALAAKSGVTVADINALAADDQALRASGFRPDVSELESAVLSLARAIASGSDTTAAKSEFNAVFAGSTVSQDTIDKAFADLSTIITDSKVTNSDIDTILADRAALKADLDSTTNSGRFERPHLGGSDTLIGSLAKLGILGGFGEGSGKSSRRGLRDHFENAGTSSLSSDIEKLRSDLQGLAAKSKITVADLTNLRTDGQLIAQSGFRPDLAKLDTAVSELAVALVSGGDSSQAKADFTAVFAGSSLSQEAIDKAFTDLGQAITDSNVTQSDLDTIAADKAAIKADLESLRSQSTSGSTTTTTSTTSKSGKATASTDNASANGSVSRRARLRARAAARRARS